MCAEAGLSFHCADTPDGYRREVPSCLAFVRDEMPMYGVADRLAVLVAALHYHESDAFVTFRDPTATLRGTLHRRIFDHHGVAVAVGACLLLQRTPVYCPSSTARYLVVTPDCVVAVFHPRTPPPAAAGSRRPASSTGRIPPDGRALTATARAQAAHPPVSPATRGSPRGDTRRKRPRGPAPSPPRLASQATAASRGSAAGRQSQSSALLGRFTALASQRKQERDAAASQRPLLCTTSHVPPPSPHGALSQSTPAADVYHARQQRRSPQPAPAPRHTLLQSQRRPSQPTLAQRAALPSSQRQHAPAPANGVPTAVRSSMARAGAWEAGKSRSQGRESRTPLGRPEPPPVQRPQNPPTASRQPPSDARPGRTVDRFRTPAQPTRYSRGAELTRATADPTATPRTAPPASRQPALPLARTAPPPQTGAPPASAPEPNGAGDPFGGLDDFDDLL